MNNKVLRQITLLTGLLLMLFSMAVCGSEVVVLVDDSAGLLSSQEITAVETAAASLSGKTGWDVLAVSTDDAGGRTAQKYADYYFLDHAGQDDGVTVLIDMDNREYYISTSGMAIRYLTDSRIEAILDDAYADMRSGDYAGAFVTMLGGIGDYYDKGVPGGQVNVDEETGERDYYEDEDSGLGLLAAVFFGIASIVFAVMFLRVKSSYQMKSGTYHYMWQNNMTRRITRRADDFKNRVVTRRHIPKDPPKSGGGGGHVSTTHSTGGHSFGGGGRSF